MLAEIGRDPARGNGRIKQTSACARARNVDGSARSRANRERPRSLPRARVRTAGQRIVGWTSGLNLDRQSRIVMNNLESCAGSRYWQTEGALECSR
jgi:hypothetical protein